MTVRPEAVDKEANKIICNKKAQVVTNNLLNIKKYIAIYCCVRFAPSVTDKTQDEGYRFIEPFVKLKTAFITVLFLYLILYSINPSLPVLRYCGKNVLIVDHVYYSP